MDPFCYGSARFSRVRIAQLDPDTLAPLAGADNGYVASGQVLMSMSPVLRTGTEQEQVDGEGEICVNFQEDDQFKRMQVRLQFCRMDPLLESLLTGASVFTDDGDIVGVQAPPAGVALANPFCLEGWTRAYDGTTQVISPATTPELTFHHWVFPYAHGFVRGDSELNSGIHLFEYSGRCDENSAITANGPFNDWPDYIADAGGVTRAWGVFQDVAPPTPTCAAIAVPAGS